MKCLLLTAALLAPLAAQAQQCDLFTAHTIFLGQTDTQHRHELGYQAQIVSTQPDGSGYIETFTNSTIQSVSDFAGHLAIQTRAACNAVCSNACVVGQPGWIETLVPASDIITVK